MRLFFTKMNGAGNDFIVINQVKEHIEFSPDWVSILSDRKHGIGCDQLLLLLPPRTITSDFFYRIFNADGTEVEQCGNGARCIGHFIAHKQLSPKASWDLETVNSQITVAIAPNNQGFRVNLGLPNFNPASLPFIIDNNNNNNNNIYKLKLNNLDLIFSIVSLGNPHVVINLEQINKLTPDLFSTVGEWFNKHPQFPKGVNINFMRIIDPSTIELITYERGAGITLACGTGSCAAAIIARKQNLVTSNFITVVNSGGNLGVNWGNSNESCIWLTGKSVISYEGYIDL